jgi:hypothetical protein
MAYAQHECYSAVFSLESVKALVQQRSEINAVRLSSGAAATDNFGKHEVFMPAHGCALRDAHIIANTCGFLLVVRLLLGGIHVSAVRRLRGDLSACSSQT